MKLLPWLALPVIALSLVCPAVAQESTEPATVSESETVKSERPVPNNNNAAARLIPPRWSVDYNSSGGGYDGFGGFSFMLPVKQRPGQQMNYLLGRLNLTNGGDIGGNILFGHRELGKCLFSQQNCFLGGYIGVDVTNTGEAAFPQLGLGLEMLSDLEMRLNGYLAVGNSQKLVEEARFTAPTGLQFQGSNLLFIDQSSRDRFQNALSGFDLEIGGKLVRFGNGGDLRGYGALYSYGGAQVDRYVGGRFRLEARPNDVWRIGAGVQFDREFGTNLLFQIAATFPSLGQRRAKTPGPTLDQLADPPLRQTAVVVAQRAVPVTTVGPIAVDPSTGKTYEFVHVAPGRGNSSGTFEDPTNTIAEATAVTTPNTDIIYVQPGNAGGGFTIPNGVAVLSVAPLQVIRTQFGQVPLPGSGQGEAARPIITDTVTMGNNTALSGFVVQPPVNRLGILGNNVGTLEITNNRISVTNTLSGNDFFRTFPSGFAAILMRNASTPGTVTIRDNTVIASGERTDGINANSPQGGTVIIADNTVKISSELFSTGIIGISGNSSSNGFRNDGGGSITIRGNKVTHSGNGTGGRFPFPAIGISGDSFSGPITITDNTVTTTGNVTVGIRGFSDSSFSGPSSPLIITDNTVNTSGKGAAGINSISISSSGPSSPLIITGNTVNTIGEPEGGGSFFSRPVFSYGIGFSSASLMITGNTVSTRGANADGIIGAFNGGIISDNKITTGGDNADGISLTLAGGTISGNEIITSGDNADGVSIGNAFFTPARSTMITDNIIITSGNQSSGLRIIGGDINTFFGSESSLTISGNMLTVSGDGADGIFVRNSSIPTNSVTIADNTVEQAGRDGVRLELRAGVFSPLTCLALSKNISQNPGSGIGYHLINSGSSTFQIVDSSPTFADTQASNVGTFVFEPDLTSFTNVLACP